MTEYKDFICPIKIGNHLVKQKFRIPDNILFSNGRILNHLKHESISTMQKCSYEHDTEFPPTDSFSIHNEHNSGLLKLESTLSITSSTKYTKEIENSRKQKNPPTTIGNYRIAPSRLKSKNEIYFSPDDSFTLELIISGDLGQEKPGINNKLIQLKYTVDEPENKQAKLYFQWEDVEEHTGLKKELLKKFKENLIQQGLRQNQIRLETKDETYAFPYIDHAIQSYIYARKLK